MYDTSTQEAELLRIYSRDDAFEPCQREQTRAWDDFKEADEESPAGKGRFFRIILATGRSVGNPPEGGDWPAHRRRKQLEASVTSAQIAVTTEMSTKFLAAGGDNGAYGDVEHDSITESMRDLFSYADVLIGCGHGTGRLAVIAASVAATDTLTLDNPERTFQLRPYEYIDIVDLDTGGTPQYESVQILSIDAVAGTITLDQNVTVTEGWGIYHEGVYGNPMPNGLFNIVDDGDNAATIFSKTRADHGDGLNATVMEGDDGLQDYSEDLVRDLLNQVTGRQDFIPTQLRCNVGIVGEHLRKVMPDRVYTQSGAGTPKYDGGANHEGIAFTYGDKKIPFRIDRNFKARTLMALYIPAFRKHTLVPADWQKVGNKILHMAPADGGGTYKYVLQGSMLLDMTISTRRLNCNGKLSNIRDRECARDV